MMAERVQVLTVGHSRHPLEDFLGLLRTHQVDAVADVRSVPLSRLHPQFNRDQLADTLKKTGMRYSYLGKELGGRPRERSCYANGQVQYQRVTGTEQFRKGIDRLLSRARRYRIALMCAEREPLDCHRGLLISPELEKRGLSILHIHADGSAEMHHDAMDRLLARFGYWLYQEDRRAVL